jgi:hypothetical protein
VKDIAFFTMLMGFVLAAIGSSSWVWFLFAALIFGVMA